MAKLAFDRLLDRRALDARAELAATAEEVIVLPTELAADLVLETVAESDLDLARRAFDDRDRCVDDPAPGLEIGGFHRHRAKESETEDVRLHLLELARIVWVALLVDDLAPDQALGDALVTVDFGLAEDRRRTALDAVDHPHAVITRIERCRLRHPGVRESALQIVAFEPLTALVIRMLREDLLGCERDLASPLRFLVGSRREVDGLDENVRDSRRRAFLDDDHDVQLLGRELEVVGDARVIVARLAEQDPHALEVAAEERGVERPAWSPRRVPGRGPGEHHVTNRPARHRLGAPHAHRPHFVDAPRGEVVDRRGIGQSGADEGGQRCRKDTPEHR